MSSSVDDPNAAREAKKYDNPIPSREYIMQHLSDCGKPLSHPQLCDALQLTDETSIEALRRRLRAMERDGQLIKDRRDCYGLVDRMDLIAGKVSGHRDGYGFLIREDGGEDIFLHNRQMKRVFDGDRVLVRSADYDRRGRLEGKIVEVLEHNTQQLVGRFYREGNIGFFESENQRITHQIAIAPEDDKGVQDGYYVLVEIIQQPGPRHMPRGRITEVLGEHMAPGMEIDVALHNYDVPHKWPDDVTAEANQLGAQVAEDDKKGRVDLRNKPFVTIDGEDARDFDDAVFCEAKKSGGWRLYVAIADVSHYVKPGAPLDEEAHQRGNSVYFPGYVVPMLPEALSNGLCSLNPKVDRLAMICEMTISAAGNISGYQFYEGLICSHARLTYTQVGALLQEPESKLGMLVNKEFSELVPHLYELYGLYKVLREARRQRGAIDFETTETRIDFGPERKIEQIVPVFRNDAHKLIEECMLCANVATARFVETVKKPGLFRVHLGPREKKLENLRSYLGELGLQMPGGNKPEPSDYQQLLESISDRPDANVIQTMMLRSMSQAVYTPDNEGHFGLGYKAYGHFTSPIRRYPDLLVHRLIRAVIRSGTDAGRRVRRVEGAASTVFQKAYPYDTEKMLALGEHCSMTERRADDATRDVVSWLKCEYIQNCVGDEFDGVISAVTNFGAFVELKDIYVEGLIHVTALPGDYYHYDAPKQRLIGERTRTVYRLGDELKVRVVRVDLEDRKIDFELVKQVKSAKRKESVRSLLAAGKIGADKKSGAKNNSKTSSKSTPSNKSSSRKPSSKKTSSKNSFLGSSSGKPSTKARIKAKTTTKKAGTKLRRKKR